MQQGLEPRRPTDTAGSATASYSSASARDSRPFLFDHTKTLISLSDQLTCNLINTTQLKRHKLSALFYLIEFIDLCATNLHTYIYLHRNIYLFNNTIPYNVITYTHIIILHISVIYTLHSQSKPNKTHVIETGPVSYPSRDISKPQEQVVSWCKNRTLENVLLLSRA